MKHKFGANRYQALSASLEGTAFNSKEWTKVCDGLAELVGGVGAWIVPQESALRFPSLPHSPALDEFIDRMFETGWLRRDPRESGFGKALSFGCVTDQDIFAPGEMKTHPFYQELLTPLGLRWFIAIAFQAGGRAWAASVQGKPERGPFGREDAEILLGLKNDLAVAANRAIELGAARQEDLESFFSHAGRAAVVIDCDGRVLSSVDEGEEILGACDLLRAGRLGGSHPLLADRLEVLAAAAVSYVPGRSSPIPRPVDVLAPDRRHYRIDAIPMPRDFQELVRGAGAIVTVRELAASAAAAHDEYRRMFDLTAREAELAACLAAGQSLSQAAGALEMSLGTARHHLKSIFGKTGTRRQAELVALLARISS